MLFYNPALIPKANGEELIFLLLHTHTHTPIPTKLNVFLLKELFTPQSHLDAFKSDFAHTECQADKDIHEVRHMKRNRAK